MSLKTKAIRGTKWTGASLLISTTFQFIQLAILSRILEPSDFGLMSIVTLIIGFFQLFIDAGVSNAIIQKQNVSKTQLSSLYWLNIFLGVFVFIVVSLCSPIIAGFYEEDILVSIIQCGALVFLIAPMGQQFQILLQKELEFRSLSIIEVTAYIVGVVSTIFFALNNLGVYSIVFGQLVNVSLRTFIVIFTCWNKWRPSLDFKLNDITSFFRFGIYQMGEKVIDYFSSNVDYIIIGKFLGTEVLGFYSLAYQLVIVPLAKVNPIFTKVGFPVLARVQSNDELIKKGYLKITKAIATIISPLLMGLAVVSPVAIPFFLGEGWEKSIFLVQVMALVGVVRALCNPFGIVLLAKGRVDIGFKWGVCVALINTVTLLIAVRHGINALAWTTAFLNILYLFIVRKLLFKLINLRFLELVKAIYTPIIISLAMTILVYFQLKISKDFVILDSLNLFLGVTIGAVIYTMLFFLFNKSDVKELFLSLKK